MKNNPLYPSPTAAFWYVFETMLLNRDGFSLIGSSSVLQIPQFNLHIMRLNSQRELNTNIKSNYNHFPLPPSRPLHLVFVIVLKLLEDQVISYLVWKEVSWGWSTKGGLISVNRVQLGNTGPCQSPLHAVGQTPNNLSGQNFLMRWKCLHYFLSSDLFLGKIPLELVQLNIRNWLKSTFFGAPSPPAAPVLMKRFIFSAGIGHRFLPLTQSPRFLLLQSGAWLCERWCWQWGGWRCDRSTSLTRGWCEAPSHLCWEVEDFL